MKQITRLGLDGVGRMGLGMSERWTKEGIDVVRFDINPDVSDVNSLEALAASMPAGERVIWLMLPMFAYEPTIKQLLELLTAGDMVIDGGNSQWQVTQARQKRFAEIGARYVDVGTSGGIYGLEHGYALMVGSTREEYDALLPMLRALAPVSDGLVHAGPSGAGHFAKEIHNGIEYGLMAALAEGFGVLSAATPGNPLGVEITDPTAVMASWRNGSIVKSFLLEVLVKALHDPGLAATAPVAMDSGEGRWTLLDAITLGVPTPVMSAALMSRFASQGSGDDAARLVAGIRHEFGGHPVVSVSS